MIDVFPAVALPTMRTRNLVFGNWDIIGCAIAIVLKYCKMGVLAK